MAETKFEKEDDLTNLSKEELLVRVKQLQAHIKQLKNILWKEQNKNEKPLEKKQQRNFDFTRYNKRHVAFKVLYLGWDYQGLAVQEDTVKTIENELFRALLQTRLVESRETSNYHRCGRTDKGVSAFGQVISLDVRTNLLDGPDIIVLPNGKAHLRQGNEKEEICYARILNKVLPSEIRVLAWAAVKPDFSARFNCIQRTYKYYFPRGSLNIEIMREASKRLLGEHDFRNFCKMDVGNGVVNYVRHISNITIDQLNSYVESEDVYQMYELTVVGQAFLWHQIRCIVAILFLIGQGLESPSVLDQLLDVQRTPCKPQYNMALEIPLVLFNCDFDDISWQYDKEAHLATISHLQEVWSSHAIRADIVKQMLESLEKQQIGDCCLEKVSDQNKLLTEARRKKIHKPLFERPTCESLESRVEYHSKRRKVNAKHSKLDDVESKVADVRSEVTS